MKCKKDEILKRFSEDAAVISTFGAGYGKDEDGDVASAFVFDKGDYSVVGIIRQTAPGFHIHILLNGLEFPENHVSEMNNVAMGINNNLLRGHFSIIDNKLSFENFFTCYDGRSANHKDLIKEVVVSIKMFDEHLGEFLQRMSDLDSVHDGDYVIVGGQ